jgi:hypothetical protein
LTRRRVAVLSSLSAVALVYLVLVMPQVARPLVYDEVNFAFAGGAVARTGLPWANAGYMSDRGDFSQREQWALWHPPLYVYLLGLQYRLFGYTETSGRILGVALNLVTGAIVFLTGRALSPAGPYARQATGVLAAAFYLLSPLTVQSALILDIDGTVLTLLLAIMAYLVIRLPSEHYVRFLLGMSLLLATSLWAKLTTPIGLFGCLLLTRVLCGRFRLAAVEALVVGAGGLFLFIVTWGLACLFLRMPFDMPFAVTWIEFLSASQSPGGWLRSPTAAMQALAPSLLWAGPYLATLFACAGLNGLRESIVTRSIQAIDLYIGFGVVVYVVYLIKLAGGFPKYHIAMMPFWAVVAATLVVRTVGLLSWHEIPVLFVGFALFAWYFGTQVPDSWVQGYSPDLGNQLVVVPAAFAGLLLAALYLSRDHKIGRALVLVLAVMALAWGPGVEHAMANNPGSITYFFGTQGQREAAAIVDNITQPDEFYIGSKDVAWYARNQHYIDQDTLNYLHVWYPDRSNPFEGQLVGHEIRVLALWGRGNYPRERYREILSRDYELLAERGDYLIWVRRTA